MATRDWLLHCVMEVPFGRIVLFNFSSESKFWVVRGHMGLQSLSEKDFISGSTGCEGHLRNLKVVVSLWHWDGWSDNHGGWSWSLFAGLPFVFRHGFWNPALNYCYGFWEVAREVLRVHVVGRVCSCCCAQVGVPGRRAQRGVGSCIPNTDMT